MIGLDDQVALFEAEIISFHGRSVQHIYRIIRVRISIRPHVLPDVDRASNRRTRKILPKIFKYLPKWRNCAKSGQTGDSLLVNDAWYILWSKESSVWGSLP